MRQSHSLYHISYMSYNIWHKSIKNSAKSGNVNNILTVLDTLLSKSGSFVPSIQVPTKVKNILAVNKQDWKRQIIYFHCSKSAFAQTKTDKDDAGVNQNVITLTVLGTLKNFLSKGNFYWMQRSVDMYTCVRGHGHLKIVIADTDLGQSNVNKDH